MYVLSIGQPHALLRERYRCIHTYASTRNNVYIYINSDLRINLVDRSWKRFLNVKQGPVYIISSSSLSWLTPLIAIINRHCFWIKFILERVLEYNKQAKYLQKKWGNVLAKQSKYLYMCKKLNIMWLAGCVFMGCFFSPPERDRI